MNREKLNNITNIILKFLKLIVFASLFVGAAVMYKAGQPQWGNDLLLTAGLLVSLNKLDKLDVI